ncbi:ribonuclease P protein component [Helicovermis profundi]|uniref:Ribonuclease P protein component n=1 Tax=Helicovermis profundi TaxID=3065157 RepID=A0AAU9EG05_9FIRM|nr:ribonuclease P protein component [Clostridia bacterium S502]
MSSFTSLKNTRQFNQVYKKGKSVVNKYVVMYYLKNNLGENRIGYSVSKKVGNSVVRNKSKRLIKEAVRLNLIENEVGYDLIFISRVRMKIAKYSDVEKAIKKLIKSLK